MEIKIGAIVKSSKVDPKDYGGAYQDKHLEVVEFLDGEMVRCIYWNNASKEQFIVPLSSLTYIKEGPLESPSSLKNSEFFNRYKG